MYSTYSHVFLVLLGALLSFPFSKALVSDELEDYLEYGGIEYGPAPPDYWQPGDPEFPLKAATCTQCPRRLRPPKPNCTSCSSDGGCGTGKICCPFITLSTSARACTNEETDNCRLANEIKVDFLRKACSCVRQIKCCVPSATLPATISPEHNVTTHHPLSSTHKTTTHPPHHVTSHYKVTTAKHTSTSKSSRVADAPTATPIKTSTNETTK